MTDSEQNTVVVEAVVDRDPSRTPVPIVWNAILGVRCPICGADFLDDGTINVTRAFDDHMTNIHPLPSILLPEVEPEVVEIEVVSKADWPKWYQNLKEKATADGTEILNLRVGETQKDFETRTGGSN